MILCVQCMKNELDFTVGKLEGKSALGVTAITCRNLGTGSLSEKCIYTPGDVLFGLLSEAYLEQVEFERQDKDALSKHNIKMQRIFGKAYAVIQARQEDALIRAQNPDIAKREGFRFQDIGTSGQTGEEKKE